MQCINLQKGVLFVISLLLLNQAVTCRRHHHHSAIRRPQSLLVLRGGNASRWPPPKTTGFGTQQQSGSKQVKEYQDDDKSASQEETKEAIDAFLTRDSRNTFIARTYGILSIQLLVTAAAIFIVGLNPNIVNYMHTAVGFRIVPTLSLLLSTIAFFTIAMSPKARRSSPIKWQLLSLFTIGESIMVAFISSFYNFQVVLSAMGATAAAATGISLYTITNKNPKYDLSQWGSGLASAGLIFIVYGLLHVLSLYGILPQGFLPYRDAWFSLFGAVLFSFYMAYHTKLIVGGKHSKYQMNQKDYVFAAMALYSDIINLFIYLLRIMGDRD